MPKYVYKCSSCHEVYEKTQSITEPADKTCDVCKEPCAQRVPSRLGVVFKGSGYCRPKDYDGCAASSSGSSPAKSEGGACCPCANSQGGCSTS